MTPKNKRNDIYVKNCGGIPEIYYFDENGNAVDKDKAVKCVVREVENDGTLVNETFAMCVIKE